MTEDEAKTKWCFAAVASHTDPRGGFREDDIPHTYRQFPCIGSACMAWRRDYSRGDNSGHGYCGMAGSQGLMP